MSNIYDVSESHQCSARKLNSMSAFATGLLDDQIGLRVFCVRSHKASSRGGHVVRAVDSMRQEWMAYFASQRGTSTRVRLHESPRRAGIWVHYSSPGTVDSRASIAIAARTRRSLAGHQPRDREYPVDSHIWQIQREHSSPPRGVWSRAALIYWVRPGWVCRRGHRTGASAHDLRRGQNGARGAEGGTRRDRHGKDCSTHDGHARDRSRDPGPRRRRSGGGGITMRIGCASQTDRTRFT
jgi:hypothetical protein